MNKFVQKLPGLKDLTACRNSKNIQLSVFSNQSGSQTPPVAGQLKVGLWE